MKLIITTNDCLTSKGFTSKTESPIAIAFKFTCPWAENITTEHNRVQATKEGRIVRFAVKGFTTMEYKNLMYGTKESSICELVPLPVPVTSTLQL